MARSEVCVEVGLCSDLINCLVSSFPRIRFKATCLTPQVDHSQAAILFIFGASSNSVWLHELSGDDLGSYKFSGEVRCIVAYLHKRSHGVEVNRNTAH